MDEQAAARLSEYESWRPADAQLPTHRLTLRNESAGALLARARTLNGEVANMREGLPTSTPFASRDELQVAATRAFLQCAALLPTNGDAWHDLGTSLFFAGEMAESRLVYAHGLALAPGHKQLISEGADLPQSSV